MQVIEDGKFKSNVAAGVAYLSIIPAIGLLLVAPFKEDRFIRFHCWQCILLTAVSIAVQIGMRFVPSYLRIVGMGGFPADGGVAGRAGAGVSGQDAPVAGHRATCGAARSVGRWLDTRAAVVEVGGSGHAAQASEGFA